MQYAKSNDSPSYWKEEEKKKKLVSIEEPHESCKAAQTIYTYGKRICFHSFRIIVIVAIILGEHETPAPSTRLQVKHISGSQLNGSYSRFSIDCRGLVVLHGEVFCVMGE